MAINKDLSRLGEVFLHRVQSIPGGEKIKLCIQCGTCSGSCPTSYAMDYTPREIISSLRAGQLDKVLTSNTVWLCASCYYCTVRCPSGIKLTDIMYELKRLGIEYGLYVRGGTTPMLSTTFLSLVDRYGRVFEAELLARFYLRTNPLKFLSIAPLGLKLLRHGRLPLLPERIKAREDMVKMLQYVRGREAA
jgi:heterodisulfide reductase subunit C